MKKKMKRIAGTGSRRRLLGGAKRIVVKLGSSLLAPEDRGVRASRLAALASQVARLRRSGRQIILVSSGAIASGMRLLGLRSRPVNVVAKQALAAYGQPELMRAYADAFFRHRIHVAQVLLTSDDLRSRARFLHARAALQHLLIQGAVPIVNENDIVAVEEIRMGDNDELSAHVAGLVRADALILLTDVDGLHTGRPGTNGAARIPEVRSVTAVIRRIADHRPGSGVGTGGMGSKVRAAARAAGAGIPALVARGTDRDVLIRAVAGADLGTLFLPSRPDRLHRRNHSRFGRGTAAPSA